MDKRSRNFTFTFNNYPNLDLVDNVICKYIIYGKEIGEGLTPHLQGFISFKTMQSKKAVVKLMPGCHIEIARSALHAVEYCKKDGDYTERGEAPLPPSEAGKKGVAERWALAKQGKFEELPPENLKMYEYIQRKYTTVPNNIAMKNEWRYGLTGAGKSLGVRRDYPDLYNKDTNKWWDNYAMEETVLIDDWDPKTTEFLVRYLKIWTDHYAFRAETKGGSMMVRPLRIIVTSQYTMDEAFASIDARDCDAIKRRFKQIHVHNFFDNNNK